MRVKFGHSELEYNSITGEFIWVACRRKPFLNGKTAGVAHAHGYLYIKCDGRNISLSRLAWEMMRGPIPTGMEIDHLNRVSHDNRISNLRVVSRSENMMNTLLKPNAVGSRGVSLHKKTGLYRARHRNRTTYHRTREEQSRAMRNSARSG